MEYLRKGDPRGVPRGSKYSIFEDFGSKSHALNGFGTRVLKSWVLGPSG